MIQRRVFISGDVQGVGFRASTFRQARQHPSVKGYVKNLADGRVEAVFAGEDREVLDLVAWCRRGPPSAKVTEMEVLEENVDFGLQDFDIQR